MATTTFSGIHGHVGHHPKLAAAVHHATLAIAISFVVLTVLALASWAASLLEMGRVDPPPPPQRVEVRTLHSELTCLPCARRTIISYAPSSEPNPTPSR
jgi:hypothetical protein